MHLYIHVPFCARRCSYCDFAIAVRRHVPSTDFRDTILAEWNDWRQQPWWAEVGAVETVYFGGGTPSHVSPEALSAILGRLRADTNILADAEITMEANPEDVEPARAEAWLEAGINRVSLGVQSFDPAVLAWMHRVHTSEQPSVAVALLRAAGFTNLSVDLIYAVPAHLGRDWAADLDRALALEVDHLSVYGLTIEAATPLGRWVARGETTPGDVDHAADEYLATHEVCRRNGMDFYEVSNAARPGRESRHNQAYWTGRTYLGLGPSAHSHRAGHRWWNIREWKRYRDAVVAGASSVEGEERLQPPQLEIERQYLGLRTTAGIPASYLPVQTSNQWVMAGWARRDGSQIILTPEGWLRLDLLVRQAQGA